MDEIENKAEAQPAWLQLAAGAGSWGLTELGKNTSYGLLNANTPFQMSIRGGRLPSICSQFQTFLNLVRGGGRNFSIISEIQNILNYPRGGGVKPNWEFFPNFLVFF